VARVVRKGAPRPARGQLKAAPARGDVWWVKLDPTIGSEIQKTRPAVIVSNDSCNRFGARVLVLPITSNTDSLYSGEALVQIGNKRGRALGDQLRSVDKRRLSTRIGTLSVKELERIDEALRITLAL
jgi:mRNA interferase MazF